MKSLHILTLILTLFATRARLGAQDAREFAKPTIDVGIVVSDLEKAAKFYTDAIGFTEVPGFEVPADFAKDAGLTDAKPLKIRVFVLGEGEGATSLKLMQVEGESKKSDNTYINSQLGISYLTIAVTSTDKALERLAKAGVKPIAKGPQPLPANLNPDFALTIVRDPDGNLVELVGPKPEKKP